MRRKKKRKSFQATLGGGESHTLTLTALQLEARRHHWHLGDKGLDETLLFQTHTQTHHTHSCTLKPAVLINAKVRLPPVFPIMETFTMAHWSIEQPSANHQPFFFPFSTGTLPAPSLAELFLLSFLSPPSASSPCSLDSSRPTGRIISREGYLVGL